MRDDVAEMNPASTAASRVATGPTLAAANLNIKIGGPETRRAKGPANRRTNTERTSHWMTDMTPLTIRTMVMVAAAAVVPVHGSPQDAAAPKSASMPRTADGKPDLSGIWQVLNTAAWDVEDHPARDGVPAGDGVVEGGRIPYQPSALTRRQENARNRRSVDPEAKCYMLGVPRATYANLPFQIFQKPDLVAIAYEYAHTIRYLYTDGSSHPAGPIEWWTGDSRARWEGDTLVVDVVHFNEALLDRSGNFYSGALHVVERFTPRDVDHINYEATLEDSNVFTHAWKMHIWCSTAASSPISGCSSTSATASTASAFTRTPASARTPTANELGQGVA
jgi:hypothetical protein